jgi:diguanylate cyclase (GGDEF)-like protein/PAS domain S-box-containing protein
MRLKVKVWLWLGALTGAILAVDLAIGYRKFDAELRAETAYDARTMYGLMMATRRIYQQQFIDSDLPLDSRTIGFLPAHSFSRIAADFAHWNTSGVIFNNVSDRPRNPGNQADRDELAAMRWFREHPTAVERMDDIVAADGDNYLLYTAPIWIEPFCLRCHGDPADAPPSIREKYDAAYGYSIGDLRGVVSIKIPTANVAGRFHDIWIGQAAKSLAGYAILFLAIGLLLDRLVTRRLDRLQTGAELFAAGNYAARIANNGDDEIGRLGAAFNRMATEVQAREQALVKLSLAVEQSPESIVITDLQGNIEYVNACFTRNTGYSRAEAIGQNPRILQSGKTPPAAFGAMWAALSAGNAWHGELVNRRKDGTEYTEAANIVPVRAADGRITHYLAVKQDITARKQAEAEIHRLAYHDALTGLPNRALLLDRLALALAVAHRQRHLDALVLLNLDRFKNLNDAHGHTMGDLLLVAFGGRLFGLLREGDTLARLGADEFAILLQDLGTHRESASRRALAVAEKIHANLRLPFRLDNDEETTLTSSIGITLCPENEGDSPEEALRRADTALHRAKDAGGNQTAFFESDMGTAARQRYTIERELRRAIAADELRLFLQPQVDAGENLVGAEVLVRWQHPERGLLPPGIFIGIAEESDLIVDLGAWVLSEACRLMARETMAGYPLHLSVNLSPRQFRQPGFVRWVKDLLAASGADPTHLTLEVTEGLVIDDIDAVVAKMSELSALGIHFSVDDFGTGYSSLAYLKRMPIHELKIDKSFVQDAPLDPNDAALVETILSVARHMHLQVVAEGVETAAQADFINARAGSLNVIHQGYFFGKPEPAEAWLARWRQPHRP